MLLKKTAAYLISMFTIAAGGYLLFNVAFIAFALVVNTTMQIAGQPDNEAPRALFRLLGYAAIGLLDYLGLRLVSDHGQSKHTLRATLLTMPLMVLLVSIGITLYQQTDGIVLAVGGAVILAALIYLYVKKLPWMYWFAVFYVAVVGVIIVVKDIEI